MSINAQPNNGNSLQTFLDAQTDKLRIHPKSLVSTFFGDVVVPNDGYTWVETIVSALEPLGVNDRLVRTTLFRMREDGWLKATRSGRKSYYQLTEHARLRTRFAEKLFYYQDRPAWDGSWTLVFLVVEMVDVELRNAFIEELDLVGFGAVTKGVWAHPSAKADVIGRRVKRLGLEGKVICMRCENIDDAELGFSIDDEQMAALCMPAVEVEKAYRNFYSNFAPLLDSNGELQYQGSPAETLSLRLLLIDEFRRVVLRDHHLPAELLPADWAGYRAYQLCAQIYRQILDGSNDQYLSLQANAGDSPAAIETVDNEEGHSYAGRFTTTEALS